MKIAELVFAWFMTVILGSAICGFFIGGEPTIIFIFIVLSGLTSLPYLLLFVLIVKKMNSFLKIQLVHLILAVLTGTVIVLFIPETIRMILVLAVYFVIGVITQSIFFYRKPLNEKSSLESEILDD